MRCLYDQYRDFRDELSLIPRIVFILATHYVRMWDFIAAQRVTSFVGDSFHIAERIHKFYGRECKVIYPPVDTRRAYIDKNAGDYYLSVGRLTGFKRVDLAIRACNQLERRLIIAGSGRELRRLKKMAGRTIEFRGRVSAEERSRLYAQSRALLFPSNEDFGIVPVEAQAHGRPVIAYGRGGALETVIESVTGVYFEEQTPDSLADAILRFEKIEREFVPERIQQHARTFDTEVFKAAIRELAEGLIAERHARETSMAVCHPSVRLMGT
jgi:glycosyltransferase involved in cell wall biosynthesis